MMMEEANGGSCLGLVGSRDHCSGRINAGKKDLQPNGTSQSTPPTSMLQQQTLCAEEVPEHYREKHIKDSYRHPNSSAAACILSAFQLNNETFNIWTQFIPFVILLIYFYGTFPSEMFPLTSIPSHYYPLLCMEFSVCTYLFSSTLAHTFNCMSPRIRHICFYVDYTAISTFGIGGACTTFYYLRPLNTGFVLFDSANLFIGGAVLCNVITVYIACASRHKWESARYVIRTLAFTLPFVYGSSPAFTFLFVNLTGECPYTIAYLLLSYTAYVLSAVLNATRFPEKYYPHVFDVLGHSHQWLHILTTMGNLSLFWAAQVALEVRRDQMPVLLDGLTLWSTVGWMVASLILSGATAAWFGAQLTVDGYPRQKQKDQ